MKSSLRSVISLLLCIVILSTAVLTGCDSTDNNDNGGERPSEDVSPSTPNAEKTPSEGSEAVVATGITLNKTAISLNKGESEDLNATITPENVTDNTLTWTTSNSSVATVADGTVTAVGGGLATITVTASNGMSAVCDVTVSVLSTGVTLNKTELFLERGKSETLIATLAPSDVTNRNLTWFTSNQSVVTVVDGTVSAIGAGTATVTVTTADGWKATCVVTVSVPATYISLSEKTLTLSLRDTTKLVATVFPYDTTDKALTWTTSDKSVATVSYGSVIAVGAGNATITVKTPNGLSATCEVTVIIPSDGIKLDETALERFVGDTVTLVATVKPEHATDKSVTWTTSNASVATVTNGTVKAVGVGKATITATNSNGDTATCEMTVVANSVTFKTLSVNGTNAYGKVSNATETFSFLDEIVLSGNATYTVSTDAAHTNTVESKTVELKVGDNTVYVIVDLGNESVVYTVVIRRRPIYTVSFSTDGGTSVGSQTVEEDSYASVPTTSKTGYTFAGWSDNVYKPIVKNTTVTAYWTANTYTLSFDSTGGTDVNDIEVTYGASYTLPVPEQAGYRFDGWFDVYGNSYSKGTWNRTADIELVAKWSVINYTISYTNNGGEHSNPESYTVEDEITLEAPTRSGFTFLGWTYEGQSTPVTEVTISKGTIGNKTFVANWGVDSYTITYDADGGTMSSYNQIVTYGEQYTPLVPQKTGYVFDGWFDAEGNEYAGGIWSKACGAALKASWSLAKITVSFDTDGGSTLQSVEITYTSTYSLPVPEKTGYNFAGWTYNGEAVSPEETWDIPQNATLVATWTGKTYKMILYPNGGNIDSAIFIMTYGEKYTLPTPVKEGYTFVCWYDAYDNEYLEGVWERTDEIAVAARWTVKQYTLTVENENATYGSVSKGGNYDYGSKLTVEATPILANTFLGWYSADGALLCSDTKYTFVIENNVTVEARWRFTAEMADFRFTFDSNSCTITNVINKTKASYVIPDFVTAIGDSAFYGCSTATSITIPSSVTSIAIRAFYNCTSLKSIVIPSSVTTIGEHILRGCSSLESLTVPFLGETVGSTNTAYLGYLFGTYSYSSHSSYIPTTLKSVEITGVTVLARYAFYQCASLTSVKLPSTLESIESHAFDSCTALVSVNIPGKVKSIGTYAFYQCSSLASINIPNGVESIGEFAFYCCKSLKNVTIPDSLTSLERCVFNSCTSLESVVIGNGVTVIIDSAFGNCSALKNVTFGSGVDNIGYRAFVNCTSLESLSIPGGVENIGTNAFDGCSALTSVSLEYGVKYIGSYAFKGCSLIKSINVPQSVLEIAEYAFANCTGLESIVIPFVGRDRETSMSNSVMLGVIFDGAEYGGVTMTKQYVPESLKSVTVTGGIIHDYAFFGCAGLTTITLLSDQEVTIGERAFYGCSALTELTLPANTVSVGNYAFTGCSQLLETVGGISYVLGWAVEYDDTTAEVSIREGTVGLSNYIFTENSVLTSITLPDSLRFIGSSAFYSCSVLKSVSIGAGLEVIGDGAFFRCKLLDTVTVSSANKKYYVTDNCVIDREARKLVIATNKSVIPSDGSVTSIGRYAFGGRSNITKIIIPACITSIEEYGFYACSNLTSVYYEGSPSDWSTKVTVENNNISLTFNATIYYFSKDTPADTENKYWHYVDGAPKAW